VKWVLQDMQLDNGVCISNYTVFSPSPPPLDKASPSKATIQRADGTTYYVDSILTPTGRTWTSPSSGKVYYLKYLVSIPAFNASFVVESLIDGQEFSGSAPVYEGVAVATGTFEGQAVTGTAWNEQAL